MNKNDLKEQVGQNLPYKIKLVKVTNEEQNVKNARNIFIKRC